MKQRIFDIRLNASYEGQENKITRLDAEILRDGEWQVLRIDKMSPGFQLLYYGLSSCQHLYFRVNAAERGLVLDSSIGRLHIVTDEDWRIQSIDIQFDGILRSGDPTQDDIDYIVDRMAHCPVSSNLVKPTQHSTRISFTDKS